MNRHRNFYAAISNSTTINLNGAYRKGEFRWFEMVTTIWFFFRSVESADEIMSKIMDDEGRSEHILKKIVSLSKDSFTCPTFHNFSPPLEEMELEQDWISGAKMPAARFFCMVRCHLSTYLMKFPSFENYFSSALIFTRRFITIWERIRYIER